MRAGLATGCCAMALLLAGCASDTPQASPATAGDADFSSLPVCAEQPSPPPLDDIPGLALPDAAMVFSVYDVGALTQAQGVVEMTPLEVRAYYENHDGLRIISIEDERVEAEILVTDGAHRLFVKAQIACATGSKFTATVGDEADAGAMPTPAGSPPPPR